jgi:hypothetical protein
MADVRGSTTPVEPRGAPTALPVGTWYPSRGMIFVLVLIKVLLVSFVSFCDYWGIFNKRFRACFVDMTGQTCGVMPSQGVPNNFRRALLVDDRDVQTVVR